MGTLSIPQKHSTKLERQIAPSDIQKIWHDIIKNIIIIVNECTCKANHKKIWFSGYTYLFRTMKYLNKWIFRLLARYTKTRILWALNLLWQRYFQHRTNLVRWPNILITGNSSYMQIQWSVMYISKIYFSYTAISTKIVINHVSIQV